MFRFFLFMLLISNTAINGQVTQISRYESNDKAKDEEFSIFSINEEGLALIRETNKYKDGKRSWELVILDTAFNEMTDTLISVDNSFSFIGYDHSPGQLHLLFQKSGINGDMRLVSFNINTRAIIQYSISPQLNLNLTHFNKVNDNFIFGGFVNLEPCLLLFNSNQENLKLIPGYFQKNTELLDVRMNGNNTFNAVILERGEGDDKKIIFRTYDSFGRLLLEDFTILDNNITVQSALSSSLIREELFVFGTWGKRNSKPASGFFSFPINPFTDDGINQVYFGELEHYLDYLKPRRATSIKLKTQRAIRINKLPDYSKNTFPYKIIEHSNGFLLIAEGYNVSSNKQYPIGYNPYDYYPYSNYNTYSPTYQRFTPSSYGNNILNTEDVTKTHCVGINFNNSGRVLWDVSLKFISQKTENLSQISEAAITKDSVFLLYKKDSELRIKSTNFKTNESIETIQKLKLNSPKDNIVSERKRIGEISHWFGNTYYLSGYQTIRNKGNSNKTKYVFYIIKIVIE